MPLLLAFILVPLIEIALFIQVGDVIGLWWTLATVVVTAIVGASLVRRQGADILARLQASMDNFRDPTTPMAEGAMVLFSGALLLTPGFFTDFVGFALLVPSVRHAIIARIGRRIRVQTQQTQYRETYVHPRSRPAAEDDIIEGEYEVEPDAQKKGPSGWTRH